jgi:hypothetical protein
MTATVRELDLQVLLRLNARHLVPLDRDRAGGVGLEAELAPLEALDLAGQSVAVPEDEDVGLGRGVDGSRQHQQGGTEHQRGERAIGLSRRPKCGGRTRGTLWLGHR